MHTSVLCSDVGFTEGPVWGADGRPLFVSPSRGVVYRVDDGQAAVAGDCGGGPNGAAEGADGRIFIAQNGCAWPPATPTVRAEGVPAGVQVVDRSGQVSWLSRGVMTSPNDLAFGPDGLLYVTDPTRTPARDDGRIWRCDPDSGAAELIASVPWYPNGIGFGPDDDVVYVADTGGRRLLRFHLTSGGLGEPEELYVLRHGMPDGFAFDVEGNILIAAVGIDGAPGEVQTWSVDGELVDVFGPTEGPYCTNVALSSDARLLISDSSAEQMLVVDGWPHAGLALHPFR